MEVMHIGSLAVSWPVVAMPLVFGLYYCLLEIKRSEASIRQQGAWRRALMPQDGVRSRVLIREPIAAMIGAAAVALALVLAIRWILIVVVAPLSLYGIFVLAVYVSFVVLPISATRKNERARHGRRTPIFDALQSWSLGRVLKEARARELDQWLAWHNQREAEAKRERLRQEEEGRRKRESCVHEPGTFAGGTRECRKCGKVLEVCSHDWVFIRGYKEESQYQCRHCGQWSF